MNLALSLVVWRHQNKVKICSQLRDKHRQKKRNPHVHDVSFSFSFLNDDYGGIKLPNYSVAQALQKTTKH